MVSSLLSATTRRPQASAPSSVPLLRRRSHGVGLSKLFGFNSSSSSSSSSSTAYLPPKKLSQQTLSRILLYSLTSIFMFYVIIVLYVARSSSSSNAAALASLDVKQSESTTLRRRAKGSQEQQEPQQQEQLLPSLKHRAKQELTAQHDENEEHSIHHPGKIIIPAAEHHGRAHQESLEVNGQVNEELQKGDSSSSSSSSQQVHEVQHIDQEEHHDPHTIDPGDTQQQQQQDSLSGASGSYILKAFLEKVDQDDWQIKPLPVRKTAMASQLKEVSFPRLNLCSRLPELFPVDDSPVNADPFLPWIHDVFPSHDGRFIQIVAQNKRRCRTGTTPEEKETLQYFQPQVSLFQHVAVKRIRDNDGIAAGTDEEIRYRLASHEEADESGMETRFICRFKPSMQETLSRHNFNYDYATWRKAGSKGRASFTQDGHKDLKALHTSQLIFQCPVPTDLIPLVQSGKSVSNDWASLFLDIIPIRTPPRFGVSNVFFPPRYQMYQTTNTSALFDADQEWGNQHVLPKIADSGRWENIPICQPSHMTYAQSFKRKTSFETDADAVVTAGALPLPHRLIACTWASSGYTTRGDRFAVTDGRRRLTEWLAYNFMIGFDHIYVYDNSPPDATLQEVTDLFPRHQVTRIPWPATICNNNRNYDDSAGERSSQYAAESSCRLRFGPHTDWIGVFDMDEYANPLGNFTSLAPLLDRLDGEGTKIFSLKSWRAWPRRDLIEEPIRIDNLTICEEPFPCFHLKVPPNRTVLQTYNCDRQKGAKKEVMPAEKQLFRSDYVLQHFIHFSTVTVLTQMTQDETRAAGFPWRRRIHTDLRHRFSDELHEASMLHAKAMATPDTAGWLRRCTGKQKHGTCRIGVPWPPGAEDAGETNDSLGWLYNCYVNEKIENYWVPKLEESLKQLFARTA